MDPVYRLFENNSKVYIDYRPEPNKRIRKSLGLDFNKKNLRAVEKNIGRVLLQFNEELNKNQKNHSDKKMKNFGHQALESSSFNRSQRTQDDYISKFKRHIVPHFGDYSIDEIKAIHVDAWQTKMLKKYSTTTVKRCKSILSLILDRAVAYEIIRHNPAKHATKFHVTYTKQEPYNSKEMQVILENSTGWFKVFMHLAFTTGMRPGELLGLKWEDINFDKGVIHLQRSISKGIVTTNTYTKNHNRMVIAPSVVLDMIKILERKSEYVFVNPHGKPFYESKSISKGYLQPLCKEFGIEYKGLKATRHTYVSIMRNGGVSQEFILDIVGHSKLVSDKHYFSNEMNDQKQSAVDNVFLNIIRTKDHI
jgi:integrase